MEPRPHEQYAADADLASGIPPGRHSFVGAPHNRDDSLRTRRRRDYTRSAAAAGDAVELIELPATGHMAFLDPRSDAHAVLCRWLERM
jgi:acetyl esterase/lipase